MSFSNDAEPPHYCSAGVSLFLFHGNWRPSEVLDLWEERRVPRLSGTGREHLGTADKHTMKIDPRRTGVCSRESPRVADNEAIAIMGSRLTAY